MTIANAPAALRQAMSIAGDVWRHPANGGRRVRAVCNFVSWQIVKRTWGRPRTIDFHGKRLRCFPDSTSTSGALYFNGLADYWEMKFVLAYLRPDDHFLDIGANAGVYSLLAAARVGGGGSIDAFEPMEDMALRIEEQARLNQLQNLHVHRYAASDRSGMVDFGFGRNDATMHIRNVLDVGVARVRAQAIRLDEFEPQKNYAMGKMDVEGAEVLALEGCTQRLHQANPPVWLVELAGYSKAYGMRSDELLAWLARHGYECALYDPPSAKLIPTAEPWKLGVQNILAIASRQRTMVERRLAGAMSCTAS